MSTKRYKDLKTGRTFDMSPAGFGRTLKGTKFQDGSKLVNRYKEISEKKETPEAPKNYVGDLNAGDTIKHINTLEDKAAVEPYLADTRSTVKETAEKQIEQLGN